MTTDPERLAETHLLGAEQLVRVLVEQVEGLRRALPLVHVARDEDALHAHLQLAAAPPPLAAVAAPGRVPLLAAFPRVAGRGRHVGGRSLKTTEIARL